MFSYDTSKIWAFDCETTGLRPYMGDRIFAFCIGRPKGNIAVYRIDKKTSFSQRKEAIFVLRKFWADTSIEKAGHNIKFDMIMCRQLGIKIPENTKIYDTSVMAKICRSDELKFSLDYLTWKYGEYSCPEDKEVTQYKNYADCPIDIMTKYQIADGERTLLLLNMYLPHITNNMQLCACFENEMELIKTTIDMEKHGIMFNKKDADEIEINLKISIDESTRIIQKYAKAELNINSPRQLAKFLFDKLKLPVQSYTNNGQRQTDKNTLLALKDKHQAVDHILRVRSYTKAVGMLVNYRVNVDSKGMIHPNINTNGADATGRQSCDTPNLQNVSKESNAKNTYAVPLRRAFRAEPMKFLLLGDYAGIQMRLMINKTREPELMRILKANGDVHYPTMECFLMPKEFTVVGDAIFQAGIKQAADLKSNNPIEFKTQRSMYKNVGFGIGFGAGPETTAATMGRPLIEILHGYHNYEKRFPLQATFSKSMIKQVKQFGYIENSFGRRFYAPKGQAYVGSNYLIQSEEAEIVKRAEVRVHNFLKREYKEYLQLIFTVHDELIFSGSRLILKEMPEACKQIRRIMIDMPEIEAPLNVEFKLTYTSWDKAKSRDDL